MESIHAGSNAKHAIKTYAVHALMSTWGYIVNETKVYLKVVTPWDLLWQGSWTGPIPAQGSFINVRTTPRQLYEPDATRVRVEMVEWYMPDEQSPSVQVVLKCDIPQ